MNNLATLIKVNFISEFKLNTFTKGNNKEKVKIISILLGVLIGFGILGYYLFSLCTDISKLLSSINQLDLILVFALFTSLLFSLTTTLYKASTYLFNGKDFNMLISLPIKESTILSSKILMILLSNYLFTFMTMLIPALIYFKNSTLSYSFFINLFILFLTTPLIPIIISSIIAFVIGSVASRFKHSNYLFIIGSIIVLILYMIGVSKSEDLLKNILSNSTSIVEGLNKVYPLTNYFIKALKNNSISALFIYSVSTIGIFGVFVIVFSKLFKSINSNVSEVYRKNNYSLSKLDVSSIGKSLFKKELNRYFSSYIYVLNTSIGVILLFVSSVGILLFGLDKVDKLLQLNIDINMLKPQIAMMVAFVIGLSCTTCISISFEGKNLWILKSLPIKEIEIFKAKILMNLVIILPISILSFLIIGLNLKFDVIFILIMLGLIIIMGLFTSQIGLLINLYFPNLNWTNEVAVVKRSISTLVSLIVNFLYIALFCKEFFMIDLELSNFNLYILSIVLITTVINLIIYKLLKTKGVKLFNSL